MYDYQILVSMMLGLFIFGVLITAFIEELIKRHKNKKAYLKNLESENKLLKRRIEAARLISELKGLDLDI